MEGEGKVRNSEVIHFFLCSRHLKIGVTKGGSACFFHFFTFLSSLLIIYYSPPIALLFPALLPFSPFFVIIHYTLHRILISLSLTLFLLFTLPYLPASPCTMKDGFRLFEIEPLEDTLDFMGPTQSSESVKLLEGIVRLSLTRPTKIRSIAVKFKGFGRVTIQGKSNNSVGLVTPMLPKLKCCISGKTLLPAGDHTIPWDLEIPNIYPPSLLIKRATIFYRVEVVISFALAKSISAEHPITLRRHLLPCKELAPLVETKIYEHTVPAKFHYEIEAPQIICLDQLVLPFAVKYLCIANQKAVQSIRTQLTQIELYRYHPTHSITLYLLITFFAIQGPIRIQN